MSTLKTYNTDKYFKAPSFIVQRTLKNCYFRTKSLKLKTNTEYMFHFLEVWDIEYVFVDKRNYWVNALPMETQILFP